MFSQNGGYSLADIAAATGGSRNDSGWGDGGGWWIIVFFIFALCGGWGNGFGGFGGGAGASGALTRADLCQDMNFSDMQNGIRGVQSGLCDGFYAMNTGMLNGFNNIGNAICNLGYEQAQLTNGVTNALMQGFNTANVTALQSQNALQTQLADCCCQNREGQAQIRYDMATNACAIQNTLNNNTRDIIQSQEAGTRQILDYLCQDKIASLTAENQTLKFAASQQAQNAYLVSVLNPTPVPSYQVPNPITGLYGVQQSTCCGANLGYVA